MSLAPLPAGSTMSVAGAITLETARTRLRRVRLDDAPFILELLNDPGWLRFIGDKNVRTLDDARRYIADGPMAMVAKTGFGLDVVESKEDGAAMGICGLIRRDGLDDVDLGFALLARYRGMGYAGEAARATLELGRGNFGIARIVAITSPDNADSVRLLERLGMRIERRIRLPGDADDILLLA
jgi:RimJ/RimL family protein N-acetyltransferase